MAKVWQTTLLPIKPEFNGCLTRNDDFTVLLLPFEDIILVIILCEERHLVNYLSLAVLKNDAKKQVNK